VFKNNNKIENKWRVIHQCCR